MVDASHQVVLTAYILLQRDRALSHFIKRLGCPRANTLEAFTGGDRFPTPCRVDSVV